MGPDLILRAQTGTKVGLYRWKEGSGFSILVDSNTSIPGASGTIVGIGRPLELSGGVATPIAYSGGTGIFLFTHSGTIEPLVVPGDQTVGGETVLFAYDIRGAGGLMSFNGFTDVHAPPSIFVRTPDGLIRRILGLTENLEGQTVAYIDSGADESSVTIRIDTTETPFRHILYRATFETPLVIPSLSRLGTVALVLSLALMGILSTRAPALRRESTTVRGR